MEFDESLTRAQYVYLAKLAGGSGRYDEMARYMEKIIRTPSFKDFTAEERCLFSFAYKNFLGTRRSAWQVVFSMENEEEGRRKEANAALIKAYRAGMVSAGRISRFNRFNFTACLRRTMVMVNLIWCSVYGFKRATGESCRITHAKGMDSRGSI
ncbi:hypothetical protein COCNU_13G003730 [Cocos nucifera]|uniref:14-3-3 domain-containing protein n=1 Tax=Cocos nucifera TaxID=13894 RepID=A0A8K0ITB0_COCNU|nr:hypothetical protein COCNU_13G003730 [Cocos nucifera]